MRNVSIITRTIILVTIFTFFLFVHFASSLEFFNINGVTYELQEIDIGRQLGCRPGTFTAVVIRNSESQEELWSYPSSTEVKQNYFHNNECPSLGAGYKEIERIWKRGEPNNVDFMVKSTRCAAACYTGLVTIFRFDGKNVTQVLALNEKYITVDFMEPDFTAIYQIYDGECNACPTKWGRDVYKWNGQTYKRIKSQVSKTKSAEPPWEHQLPELKY
ncbi:MAG: hypothetical protein AB1598_12035 [Thermodesulfobacteriota bacterium]